MANPSTTHHPFFLTRWIATYRHILTQTLTNLDYYVDILNGKFRTSLKFFIVSYLLITLGLTVHFVIKELPLVRQDIESIKNELIVRYPADLVINWDGDNLSLQPEPELFIPYPEAIERPEEFPQQLAIIQPNQTEPNESISSLVFFNKDRVWVNSLTQGWNDTSLQELLGADSWSISRESINSVVPNLAAEIQQFSTFFPVLFFLYTLPGLLIVRLISLAIDALILHLIFHIQRKPIPYLKTLQLALHIMVPIEILHQITRLALPDSPFPMLTLGFWAIAFLLVWHFRSLHVFPEQK